MSLLVSNQSTWNKKTVLFVHGIGIQKPKFSEPLHKILRAADPATVDATRWHEIAYDSVNEAIAAKVIQFQSAIPKSPTNPEAKAVVSDMLIDLSDYLISVDPYNWINNVYRRELVDVVEAGQKSGVNQGEHQIFILSHSLGTVVSYEMLHSILTDAQVLGVTKRFRIKCFFTLGSPLAFIKKNENKLPTLNSKSFLRSTPIQRPTRLNSVTEVMETNVLSWINIRQKVDPVGSLVPLEKSNSGEALSEETLVFDKFHAGLNPHAFDNYLTEYASFIMEKIRG